MISNLRDPLERNKSFYTILKVRKIFIILGIIIVFVGLFFYGYSSVAYYKHMENIKAEEFEFEAGIEGIKAKVKTYFSSIVLVLIGLVFMIAGMLLTQKQTMITEDGELVEVHFSMEPTAISDFDNKDWLKNLVDKMEMGETELTNEFSFKIE